MRARLLIILLVFIYNSCDLGEREASCTRTAEQFAANFNSQDFRSISRLFQTDQLNSNQYKRLQNNLRYIFKVAGTIRSIDFVRREDSRITFKSIHEHTSMDIMFRVNRQCQLISYMINTHYPDSLPNLERNVTKLALPFRGEWHIDWGGPTVEQNYHNRHRNMRGAIDFSKKDQSGNSHENSGKANEDYFAFGEEVLAPCRATVIKVIDGIKDNPVGRTNAVQTYGNVVVLKTEGEEYILLAHLQNQSVAVSEGQVIERGELLARCGNSGYSKKPHLHFIVQNVADLFHPTGASCYFDAIVVNGVLREDYSPVRGETVRNPASHAGQVPE